jgi:hypothetical protein
MQRYPGTILAVIQSGSFSATFEISGNARATLKFENHPEMPSKMVAASFSETLCNPKTVLHVSLTLFLTLESIRAKSELCTYK